MRIYQTVIVLFLSIVVTMKINRKHYFWNYVDITVIPHRTGFGHTVLRKYLHISWPKVETGLRVLSKMFARLILSLLLKD